MLIKCIFALIFLFIFIWENLVWPSKLLAVLEVALRIINAWTLALKLPKSFKNNHFVKICL
jgi:hypothetical protein